MALPILTSGDDVTSIVDYLKTKPTGATLEEAKAVVKKQVLDGRKIAAYQAWGIVQKDGSRLKLSELGWALGRNTKSEEQVFREVIDGIKPYRSALEWIFHQGLSEVTNVDVAANWHEHHSEAIGTENDKTIKDQAVCFFRLCEGAKLGTVKIGRRGQPTRLEVDSSALKAYIEAGPSTPPWTEVEDPGAKVTKDTADEEEIDEEIEEETEIPSTKGSEDNQPLKVFISHGKNTELVDQVETLLGLADFESEVAVKEETAAIPVPDKVFSAMRRCDAGIIIVSAEEGSADGDEPQINQNVLIEIGAAFVLYDRRVVLLWDKRLAVPSNLQGLYRCEYDGDDLNWGAGMKLMKAIKGFKT